MKRLKWVISSLIVLSLVQALASKPEPKAEVDPKPAVQALSFKKWKESQVVEAKNRVVRLSNKIHLLESKKYEPTDEEAKDKEEAIEKNEAELEKALQQLQFSKDLTMEDYYAVYLQGFSNNPEALKSLAKKLSPDELAELLQILMKSKKASSIQEVRSKKLLSGLSTTEAGLATF